MAENRPYRPFAADFQVVQRTFLMQAGVCRIRVLPNFVVEDNFFVPRNNLGQPSSSWNWNFVRAETDESRVLFDPETLPNQFDGLDFSIHWRRRRDQDDSIILEFDCAHQFFIYIVLNRRDFDVMGYLFTA